MPTYEVTAPDGQTYEIDAPDGATEDQVLAYAQQNFSRAKPEGKGLSKPAPKKARSVGDEAVRQLGLGTRALARGATSIAGIVTDPIVMSANSLLGTNWATSGQAMDQAADAAGLPQPETGAERFAAKVIGAVGGVGGSVKAGQTLAGGLSGAPKLVAQQFAANPGAQTVAAVSGTTAADLAREAGLGPTGQTIAGVAGGMAPSATAATLRGALRGGEQGRQRVIANQETFARAGAGSPTVGQATEGRFTRGLEALLGRTPGGAGVLARKGEAQQAGMGAKAEEIASSLSTKGTAEQAGRAIESGVTGPGGFMRKFNQQASALYDQVDQHLPPETNIAVSSTKATLDKLASPTPGAVRTSQVMASGKIADLRNALDEDMQASLAAAGQGQLPYGAVKALRSRLGQLIADSTFATDAPTKQLREVYAALSDDLTKGAVASGNPKALEAVKRANAFYKAGMNRMDTLERVVERNGGPEKVFAAAMSGNKEGATTLRAVLQSLPADAQKQVASAVIRRMGRAKPGAQDELGEAFSSETFLTNFNTMSPEARKALFDRFGPRYVNDLKKISDLQHIAKTAANRREGSQVFKNPSNTSDAVIQGSTAGAFGLSVLTGNFMVGGGIAAGVLGANATARAMASPTFVGWLARQTNVPASQLPQQIRLLEAEAKAKGDEDAMAAASAMRSAYEQAEEQKASGQGE